ncbi:unnamed protein product [Clavelina lepadiformis]|uniref:C-type lectin domain-containing protein n=1 Tax=Clavelina lepadiformis TaxID=159417 RepID=A0ABP0FKG3_CLALP
MSKQFLTRFQGLVDGNSDVFQQFTENSVVYKYESPSGSKETWYNAYRKCKNSAGFTNGHMAEFPNPEDWAAVADSNSLDTSNELWIGLIVHENKAWWASGQELTAKKVDEYDWLGKKPFTSSFNTPECGQIKKSGKEIQIQLKICHDEDEYVLCQETVPISS